MIVYYYVIVGWLTLCFSDIIIDGVRASSLVGQMAKFCHILRLVGYGAGWQCKWIL